MFELIVRVVIASGAMATAGILGRPDFELAWKGALFFAAYSYLLYMMEQKGARNPGVSGLAAVADCGILAVFIGDLGLLQGYGALSALPMLYAFFRFKSNAAMMAPLVAGWLLVGANLFGGGNAFTPVLLVQALGVLLFGVVLSQIRAVRESRAEARKTVVKIEPVVASAEEPKATAQPGETVVLEAAEYEAFRESYRELSDGARELERRGRKDRACVQLFESAVRQSRTPFAALTARIHDLTGAEGVAVFTVSHGSEGLVLRGSSGTVVSAVGESEIEAATKASDQEIDAAVRSATLAEDAKTKVASVVLRLRGRIVGAVALFHSSTIELEASLRRAKETVEFVAELVSDLLARDDERRRMREAELLYAVATTSIGATTAASLAARVARDLFEAVRLDHLSVWQFEGGRAERLALEGTDHSIANEVSYADGKGPEGWLRDGSPVVSIANARSDRRISSQEAVRHRVGGLLIVPLEFGSGTFGYVVATTTKPNGIGRSETETVRAVCAELSQCLARLQRGPGVQEGLTTPKEFLEIVKAGGEGHLVYLEVPQRDELIEAHGKPAIEHAVRRLAVRLRSELPQGAALTRRNEGDFVAYLPTTAVDDARKWANEATALASMTALTSPTGTSRIPLALRAKVAPVDPQIHRISNQRVA